VSSKQAYIEVEKRASGIVRVRVVPSERGRRVEARNRRAFINSREFPDSKSGYGAMPRETDFGRQSKRLVKEYTSAIERAYNKDHCRFVTATFPGSGAAVYEVIAKWSGWITAQMNQWLRDVSPFTDFVYVWEFQKRGALHLHYLIANRDKKRLRTVHRRFKTFWKRLLNTLCKKSGIDIWQKSDGSSWRMTPHVVRTAVQAVKKSVSAYLAKYLSKSQSKGITSDGLCPSRWWGASQGARSLCARYTKRVATALRPLSEATDTAEAIIAKLGAVAVPIFQYTSKYATGLRAWVVCASPEASDGIFDSATAGGAVIFGDCDTLHYAITDTKPRAPTLGDVALFFNGAVVERYHKAVRVLRGNALFLD
jgi:hypothetical protein